MIYINYSSGTYYRYKSGAQHKPINGKYPPSTTIYVSLTSRITAPWSGLSEDYYLTTTHLDMLSRTIKTKWTNKLYDKLREELVGTKSELLTSTVEWRTSLDMISGRARQLGSAFLAVKRFQFKKAARLLRIQTPSRFKNLSSKGAKKQKLSPTAAWLEYWMGWAPMIGDIGNSIDIIQSQPPELIRKFSVGVGVEDHIKRQVIGTGQNTTNVEITHVRKGIYSAYGKVKVTNHNHDLANRLGLTNPALTLWQIVPFSFIVDWFANVGKVLSSFTDFMGLTFVETGTALRLDTKAEAKGHRWISWDSVKKTNNVRLVKQIGWSTVLVRTPGALPKPRLDIVMLDKLSLTRAATSIALLVESFLRK